MGKSRKAPQKGGFRQIRLREGGTLDEICDLEVWVDPSYVFKCRQCGNVTAYSIANHTMRGATQQAHEDGWEVRIEKQGCASLRQPWCPACTRIGVGRAR